MTTLDGGVIIKKGGGGTSPAPMPSAPIAENDVTFYDYDGTVLYAYTWEEALAMTELPPLPTRKGLICQEWNYTLEDIKAQNGKCNIGANYITDDGKTRLRIQVPDNRNIDLEYIQSVSNGVVVDWGDGSPTETFSDEEVYASHIYKEQGEYVITLEVVSGTIQLGIDFSILGSFDTSYQCLREVNMGSNIHIPGGYDGYTLAYACGVEKISIPAIGEIGNSIYYCSLLAVVLPRGCTAPNLTLLEQIRVVSLPNTMTEVSLEFVKDGNLRRAIIPASVTNIKNDAFGSALALQEVHLSSNIITIGETAFTNLWAVDYIKMPKALKYIESNAFKNTSIALFDFSDCIQVPSLASSDSIQGKNHKIIVPDNLYDQWIAATNWSAIASYIIKKSDWDALNA